MGQSGAMEASHWDTLNGNIKNSNCSLGMVALICHATTREAEAAD